VWFTERDSFATDQRSRRASGTEISLIPIQYPEGRHPVRRQESSAPPPVNQTPWPAVLPCPHPAGLQHPTVTIWDLQDPRAVVDLPVADRIEVVAMWPDERFVAAGDGQTVIPLTLPNKSVRHLTNC